MKKEHASLVMGYWKYASLEELHHRSQMWLSEIAFWKEELFFMQKLVSGHFVYFTDKKHVKETFSLTDEIKTLETALASIEEQVAEHEKRLKRVVQMQDKKREEDYRTEHGTLEKKLDGFIVKYKGIKKALFREADDVLKTEKMERLISLSG